MADAHYIILSLLTALNVWALASFYAHRYFDSKGVLEFKRVIYTGYLNGFTFFVLFIHSIYYGDYLDRGEYTIGGLNLSLMRYLYLSSIAPIVFITVSRIAKTQTIADISNFLLSISLLMSLLVFASDLSNVLQGDITPPYDELPAPRRIFFVYSSVAYPLLFAAFSITVLLNSNKRLNRLLIDISLIAAVILIGVKSGFKYHYNDYYKDNDLRLVFSLWQAVIISLSFAGGAALRDVMQLSPGQLQLLLRAFSFIYLIPPFGIIVVYWILIETISFAKANSATLVVAIIAAIVSVVATKFVERIFK